MEGTVDLKDIKAIIDLMKKNSISEFEMEKQDLKIRLKRVNANGPAEEAVVTPNVSDLYVKQSTGQPQVPTGSLSAGVVEDVEIKPQLIATFYLLPRPEAA